MSAQVRRVTLLAWGGAWAIAMHAAASPVLAQQRVSRLPEEDKGILAWVIAFGVAVLFAAAVFINPKRTHLD